MLTMKKNSFKTLFPSFLTISFLYLIINLILSGYCFAGPAEEKNITLESAVKTAIENNTDLFIASKEVEVSEGALQTESGAFDMNVSNSVSYVNSKKGLFSDDTDNYAGDKSAETNTSYNLNYTRKKRSGNTYNVSISSLQELDNKIPTEKKHNTGNVNISVTVPLARGKGAAVATAAEKSASASLDASRLDYSSNFAATVLKTVNAYWDYCVIYRKLEILKQAVAESEKTMNEAQVLFKKGSIHKEELSALVGSLNENINLKIQFENALNEAGENLKLLMGLYDEKPMPHFKPVDDFPAFTNCIKKSDFSSLEIYLNKAFQTRPDFLACQKRLEIAGFNLVSAEDSTKPGIDLQIGGGYNGISEGTSQSEAFKALNRNISGANANASLVYEWPCANNKAKGRLKQQKASYEQQAAKVETMKKQIRSSMAIALSNLIKSAESLESAKKSVEAYEKSVNNEAKKYARRNSSSIDLISLQDRLTIARANLIDAAGACTKSLAAFKYELGLINGLYFTDKAITFSELTNFDDIK